MKNYKTNNDGGIAIEFALLFPVLILIVLALIEFGMYFLKDQIALNSVGSVSSAIQSNPADPSIETLAKDSGSSFMGLDTAPNYFCAKSYIDYNDAKANFCVAGDWETIAPAGHDSDDPYYVALEISAKKFSLGLASNFLPDVKRNTILQINPKDTPPICNGVDKVLQVNDDGEFVCEDTLKCPSYMTKVEKSFCIDNNNRPSSTIREAYDNCYSLDTSVDGKDNYTAYLCEATDLATADRSSVISLVGKLHYGYTDISGGDGISIHPYNTVVSVPNIDGRNPNRDGNNNSYPFRCCIRR